MSTSVYEMICLLHALEGGRPTAVMPPLPGRQPTLGYNVRSVQGWVHDDQLEAARATEVPVTIPSISS